MRNMPAALAAEVDALNAQAHALRHRDARAGLALAEQAHALALRLDHQPGLAQALLRRAVCLSILGDEAQPGADCDSLLQQAVVLLRSLGDRASEADALNQQGVRLALAGHTAAALTCYHQVRALRAALGDVAGESAALHNIALQHRGAGELDEALAFASLSLQLAQQAAQPSAQAYALTNLGKIVHGLGEPAAAQQYLQQSLALVQAIEDHAHESTVLVALAGLHAEAGQAPQALQLAQQAWRLARGTGNLGDQIDALLACAWAQQRLGAHEAAAPLLQHACTLAHKRGAPALVAEALLGQAESALALAQPAAALPLLAQALQLAEQARAQQVCARAHEALSRAHEAAGDLAAALHHHRAFHAGERQRYNPPGQRRLRQFLQQQALASAHDDVQAERQRSAELAQALEEARRAEQSRSELLAELQAQAELLQQLARVDGLTGVANRRWLDLQLLRETERARRFGHPLAVAMVDVDHFKAVNDGLSHAVGDAVLRQLAGLLRSGCRASDVVGRYGGEEFVLILVETTAAQALEACEKLRERVAAHPWGAVHAALPGLSVSIGVAGFEAGAAQAQDDLLARADQALYRAKHGGRNRVCG